MNIDNIHILRTVVALLFCVVVASCLQDKLHTGQGESLPQGKYPLQLTATVDGMTTRSAGKDVWNYNDAIGAKIYPANGENFPVTGKYFLNVDGTVRQTENPVSWTYTDGTVKAWFPYVGEGEVKTESIADQSGGLKDYDFLTAVAENENYANTVSLNFRHQMAKVSCKLMKGDGVTNGDMTTAKVSYYGCTKASFSEGTLTGTDVGLITPTFDTELSYFEALLVPQDMTGKAFIKVSMKVYINGHEKEKTLIYTPKEGEADLQPGTRYTYTVTVRKDDLTVERITAKWDGNTDERLAKSAVFRVNMPENHPTVGLTFEGDVKTHFTDDKKNDYIEVTGNSFTMFYDVPDDKGIAEFKFVTGTDDRNKLVPSNNNNGRYTFEFYLRSEETTLTYNYRIPQAMEIGDFYYYDGTTSDEYVNKGANNPCIGIVFKVDAGGTGDNYIDKPEYYGAKEAIKGYVVALQDASENSIAWCAAANVYLQNGLGLEDVSSGEAKYKYNGYTNYKTVLSNGDYQAEKDKFYAIYAVETYNDKVKAPNSLGGWYLPAVGQLLDIAAARAAINEKLDQEKDGIKIRDLINYTDFIATGSTTARYWSSNTKSKNAYYVTFSTNPSTGSTTKNSSMNSPRVRAILTF